MNALLEYITPTNLRYVDDGSHDAGADEVLAAVTARLADRYLAARHHHRLAQVLEHEGQCRRREAHRVRAVQHHKPIVALVRPLQQILTMYLYSLTIAVRLMHYILYKKKTILTCSM